MHGTSSKIVFRFLTIVFTLASIIGISAFHPQPTAAQSNTFRNPLNPDHGSDPWMQYYNGFYYLTTSTWDASPSVGIRMKKASTIAGLKAATPVTVWSDSTPSRCCNVWAPEFHLLNGPNGQRWYMYYVAGVSANVSNQYIHVLESAGLDPMGPYTYRGRLFDAANDNWAVDPTVLQLNGQLYLLWSGYAGALFNSSQNIYGMAMSNPWTVTGSRALISVPTFSWETGTAPVNEGPEILKRGSITYLIFSATWCGNPGYKLGRSTYNGGNVLSQSSWVKHSNPVFQAANGQFSTAHNGFFKSPDGTEDWIVYHGTTSSGGACDNTRTTRIQKFTWNADNTPNFGSPLPLTTDIIVPSGEGGVQLPTNTPILTPTRTNTPPPTQTNPIVWYPFDGNANDSSGNNRHATLVNGTNFTTGRVGQAANINGGTQHISLPAGIVNGLTNFTISTWVKLDTTANWRRIFDFGTGTTVNMFLTPTSGSTIRFAITTSGAGGEQRINGTAALPTGVWKHVVVTRNGNVGTLYVDGVQVGQNTNMTLSPSSLGNTTANYIGRSQYTADTYLDGQIDQFRIYNRALSASEVMALFQNP